MKIKCLQVGPIGTNCYLLCDEDAKTCAVIDPGGDGARIAAAVAETGCVPCAILLTHGHFDHVGGVAPLYAELGCKVYLCQKDTQLPPYITAGQLCYTDFYAEGDDLSFGALRFHVIETPGHTPGGAVFKTAGALFTGDTLFAGSCGRVDFPGSDWGQMCASLRRLDALEGDYTVYPGHEWSTTLSRERAGNPYIRSARQLGNI